MARKKIKRIIGKCGFCNKMIYEGQKYEILPFTRPLPWEEDYKQAPIHVRCRLPALKRFNKELMRDISTLIWFVKGFRDGATEEIKNKKEKTKREKVKKCN